MNTISFTPVKLTNKSKAYGGELAEKILMTCGFCTKVTEVNEVTNKISRRLSGNDFYCTFCLRHGYGAKHARHILPLSFRAVVGYYYYEFHLEQERMWLSEIKDYVESHRRVGLSNPLFDYDEESMMWFVNFDRVGRSKRKIKLDEVLKTVVNVLACFNLPLLLPEARLSKFYSKYKNAIVSFYQRRHRTEDRRLLVPTLKGCLSGCKCQEKMKNFLLRDVISC